jgi:hypothetical protein
MILKRLLIAVCVLAASSHVVVAQVAVGSTVGQTIDMGSRSVPLPQGRWTVVSEEGADSRAKVRRVVIAELEHNVLSRWMYVATSVENNRDGWKRNKSVCDRKNAHFAYSDSNNTDKDIECWIVNHYGMTMGNDPHQAWISFYRWSDTQGRPNTAVGLEYYFVKNGDFLLVGFYANPVIDGFPDTPTGEWRGNPWHPDIASKDPKRLAYLKALKAMGDQYFGQLRTVLH